MNATTARPSPVSERTPAWEDGSFAPPRVTLTPIAAPSILGLLGFAIATFMVASNLAGWFGTPLTPLVLWPLAAAVGGVAQFLAGMWAYRARDGVATAAHGIWGAFWVAYGILWLLISTGTLAVPVPWYDSPPLGYWFFALAIATAPIAIAALFENVGTFLTLTALTVGSAFLAVGFSFGMHGWVEAGGWVLVGSAAAAWYVASALMLAGASGRTILPIGEWRAEANRPGARPVAAIELPWAEPGIKHGQ